MAGGGGVIGDPREACSGADGPGAGGVARGGVGMNEEPGEDFARFLEEAAHFKKTLRGGEHAESFLDLPGEFLAGVEGVAQVELLEFETREPGPLFATANVRLRLFREAQEVIEMALAKGGDFAGFDELFVAVVPDGLEDEITRAGLRRLLDGDERFIHKLGEQIHDRVGIDVASGADRLDGLERAPAGEDGEAAEERALGLGEEIEAPVDERAEGLLAWDGGAAAGGEKVKAVVEPLDDLLEGEDADAGGGELDGERDAVEPPADLRDEVDVVVGERKGGACDGGAFDEEAHGFKLGEALEGVRAGGDLAPVIGQGERRERPCGLAGDAERLAAAGEDAQVGRGAEEGLGEAGAGGDDVLAVVEDEQEMAAAEEGGEGGDERAIGLLAEIERGGDGLHDERGIVDGGEFHKPNAVGKSVENIGGNLQGEAGFAGAAGAAEGEQAGAREQALYFRHLALPADKAGELDGEIIRDAFERAERGKLGGQIGGEELVEMLGAGEVAEAVFAEMAELHAVREEVANELLGGEREQDLAAVRGGEDAGDAIEGLAEIVAIALLGGAGVQGHADFQFLDLLPGGGVQSALGLEGAGEPVLRGIEGDAKGVADGLENMAAAGFEGGAQQSVVLREGAAHGLGLALPFLGAAFDVAEEKGDRPGGRRSHREECGAGAGELKIANWKMRMGRFPVRMRVLPFVFLFVAVVATDAAEWWVGPEGNDAWSGKLAAPNAERTDGPLATLPRARDAVRAARQAGDQSAVTVEVRAGIYELTAGLKLDASDSGTAEAPVVWRAFQNEKPVLIGGRTITGWKPWKHGIMQADLGAQGFKGAAFKQLLFAGQRQHLARYPNFDPQNPYGGGWAYADGEMWPMYVDKEGEDKHTLKVKNSDWRQWARPEEVEVFVFPRYNWWNDILRVKAVDEANYTVTTARDGSYAMRANDRFFFQGAMEELDAPGEWYLDRAAATVYFLPPAPIASAAVSVAALVEDGGQRVLRIEAAFNHEKTRDNYPIVGSRDVELKPGASYRLSARLRSDRESANAAVLVQFYLPAKDGKPAHFWASSPSNAKVTREWQLYEFAFSVPAPGEKGWHEKMRLFRVRLDWPAEQGSLFADDVALEETELLDEWQTWQLVGGDRESVIADPKFLAPEKDDYRLAPDSPAWALGFQAIPVEKMGPYASPERASWPIVEAEGAREKGLMP